MGGRGTLMGGRRTLVGGRGALVGGRVDSVGGRVDSLVGRGTKVFWALILFFCQTKQAIYARGQPNRKKQVISDCGIFRNKQGGKGKNYPPFLRPQRLLQW